MFHFAGLNPYKRRCHLFEDVFNSYTQTFRHLAQTTRTKDIGAVFVMPVDSAVPEDISQMSAHDGVNWVHLLPREIRDMIYEYVLTEEGGIIAEGPVEPFFLPNNSNLVTRFCDYSYFLADDRDAWTSSPEMKYPSQPEHNQLRHVCSQLREETSGLSIRFNDLIFIEPWLKDDEEIVDDDHLMYTLNSLSHTQLQWLRRIIVLDKNTLPHNIEPNMIALKCGPSSPLVNVLAQYPQLRIIVRFSWNDYLRHDSIFYVDSLSCVLRGKSPFQKIFHAVLVNEEWMDSWKHAGWKYGTWSEQLRWTVTWGFEKGFEEDNTHETLDNTVENKMEVTRLLEVARQMHHDGI